jgi:ATP-dependent Clp protease ATP-binding subunit ClpA
MNHLRELGDLLSREIRGQATALSRILSVLQRGQLGLSKSTRPRGSFLLLGPTGVGKTETVVVATRHLFGPEGLVRFDMSEFQTQDSIRILLGNGGSEEGQLPRVRAARACGSLLFDEIEKAHPKVLDLFLQLLDAGRLTAASGDVLDFSGFYVWLTSNIASSEIVNLQYSGDATLERHVLAGAQMALRPELFARIQERIVFYPLGYDIQLEIARKFLEGELAFLENRGHRLTVKPEVMGFLVRKGFHPKLGARPMRDTIERLVGEAIAARLLRGDGGPVTGSLFVDAAEGVLVVR